MTHVLIKVLHAVINLNHYCFLNRQFSSCDETGLKRSASYPLIHSESFQLATTEGKHTNQGDNNNLFQGFSSHAMLIKINLILCLTGPEMLHAEDTQSLCPANRKVCEDEFTAVQF